MLRAAKTCLQLYGGYLLCVEFAIVLLSGITDREEEKETHTSQGMRLNTFFFCFTTLAIRLLTKSVYQWD